jgi:hypothetical protein
VELDDAVVVMALPAVVDPGIPRPVDSAAIVLEEKSPVAVTVWVTVLVAILEACTTVAVTTWGAADSEGMVYAMLVPQYFKSWSCDSYIWA